MVEINQIPDSWFDSTGGKSIHHIARYTVERGPVTTKQVIDVVTDDGSIYRWSRFSEGEPWNWQYRVTPEGERSDTRYTLPSKVGELLERTEGTVYK